LNHVRRQGFWNRRLLDSAESLAHLLFDIRRLDWRIANAKRVNDEITALGDDGTFHLALKTIDKKLRLPRGSGFEMGGYAD
jgi:hypothetical protein